jgi:hypothetical protein
MPASPANARRAHRAANECRSAESRLPTPTRLHLGPLPPSAAHHDLWPSTTAPCHPLLATTSLCCLLPPARHTISHNCPPHWLRHILTTATRAGVSFVFFFSLPPHCPPVTTSPFPCHRPRHFPPSSPPRHHRHPCHCLSVTPVASSPPLSSPPLRCHSPRRLTTTLFAASPPPSSLSPPRHTLLTASPPPPPPSSLPRCPPPHCLAATLFAASPPPFSPPRHLALRRLSASPSALPHCLITTTTLIAAWPPPWPPPSSPPRRSCTKRTTSQGSCVYRQRTLLVFIIVESRGAVSGSVFIDETMCM